MRTLPFAFAATLALVLAALPAEAEVVYYQTCTAQVGETSACVCSSDPHRECASPSWGDPCGGNSYVVLFGPPTGEQGVCF